MECIETRNRPNLNGLCLDNEEVDDEKKEKIKLHNYKLLVDPFIKGNGAKKIYRFDGLIPEDPAAPTVITKDPRRQNSQLWAPKRISDLPLPRFKIDKNYYGKPPSIEVTITNINDNIREKFLEDLCVKYGNIEELKIFYHPISKKHLTIGRIVYMQPKSARSCIEKLNKTSVMGKALNVFLDPRGTHCYKIVDCLINSNASHLFDINQYILKNIEKSTTLVMENYNSYSIGPILNVIDGQKSDSKVGPLLKNDPRLSKKDSLKLSQMPQDLNFNNSYQQPLNLVNLPTKQMKIEIEPNLQTLQIDQLSLPEAAINLNVEVKKVSKTSKDLLENLDSTFSNSVGTLDMSDSPKSNISEHILGTNYTLQLLTANNTAPEHILKGEKSVMSQNSSENCVVEKYESKTDLNKKYSHQSSVDSKLHRVKWNNGKNNTTKHEINDKHYKDKSYSSLQYVSSKYDKYRHSASKIKMADGNHRTRDHKRYESSKYDKKSLEKIDRTRDRLPHHRHDKDRLSSSSSKHHTFKNSSHSYSRKDHKTTHGASTSGHKFKLKESKVFFHSKKIVPHVQNSIRDGHPKFQPELNESIPKQLSSKVRSPVDENDIDKMSLSPLSSYEEEEEVTKKLGRCKSKIITPAKKDLSSASTFNSLQSRFGVNVWTNQANSLYPMPNLASLPFGPPLPGQLPYNLVPPPIPHLLGSQPLIPPPPIGADPVLSQLKPATLQTDLKSPLKDILMNGMATTTAISFNEQGLLNPALGIPSQDHYTFNAIFQKISPHYQDIIKKVISKLFEDLSLVINKDLHKNLVQGTAFTFYDNWWQESQEKHKDIKFPDSAIKISPQIDAAITSGSKEVKTENMQISIAKEASVSDGPPLLDNKPKRWVPPSRRDATELLSSLFESAKDPWRSYNFDNSLSLGIRASMPKMPSFRKIRKATPQPSTPLKDNQNVLNQTQKDHHKVHEKKALDRKKVTEPKVKDQENIDINAYKPVVAKGKIRVPDDDDTLSGVMSESDLSDDEVNDDTEIPSSSVEEYPSEKEDSLPPPLSLSLQKLGASKAVEYREDEEMPEAATYEDLDSDTSSLFERPAKPHRRLLAPHTPPLTPPPTSATLPSPVPSRKVSSPSGLVKPEPDGSLSEQPVKFLSEHCYSLPPSGPALATGLPPTTTPKETSGKETKRPNALASYMARDKALVLPVVGATARKYERRVAKRAHEPKKRYPARDGIEEMRILYNIWNPGIDAEDIRYIKRGYDKLLLSDQATAGSLYGGQTAKGPNAQNRYLWLNYTHWVPHMATFEEPPFKKFKPYVRINKSGSARTEGYYKISAEDKASYLTYHSNERKEPNKKLLNQVTTSRQVRSDFRRQLWSKSLEMGDLIKFNQLKARKKQIAFKKSYIHDWGLYANEPMGADEMVIEYVGEIVRQVVADKREKIYTEKGIGSSYLFRIDADTIIDATKCGNLARFINHSCNPNCYAKIISVDQVKKIVIYSKQPINVGEEITYDYKFPIEDDKIPCLCGASNCRGTLN